MLAEEILQSLISESHIILSTTRHIEVHWPCGRDYILKDIKANHVIFVKEGGGITRSMNFQKISQGVELN